MESSHEHGSENSKRYSPEDLIVFLVVVWILFPIVVWHKFNELLESQRAIHRALLAANTVRDEIAKALQWMVNNWRDDSKPPSPPLG